ncbi:GNAT family N-acetyltransferase [Caballeronia choica]|uniref:GNAT family N-acetyltransferase n=1 Tax=Caballeronia choica TaxID=326476 RepID=UPI0035B539A8
MERAGSAGRRTISSYVRPTRTVRCADRATQRRRHTLYAPARRNNGAWTLQFPHQRTRLLLWHQGGRPTGGDGGRTPHCREVRRNQRRVHAPGVAGGLDRLLMEHLSPTIQERDKVPFLHVFTNNVSAVRLYRELGVRTATTLQPTAIVRSSADAR